MESLGLANARDIVKMIRWNDKFGIKFMRLSSEMFPFASHEEYGYKLAPFASEALAEAGKVAEELGHRLTTHPGQVREEKPQRSTCLCKSLLMRNSSPSWGRLENMLSATRFGILNITMRCFLS